MMNFSVSPPQSSQPDLWCLWREGWEHSLGVSSWTVWQQIKLPLDSKVLGAANRPKGTAVMKTCTFLLFENTRIHFYFQQSYFNVRAYSTLFRCMSKYVHSDHLGACTVHPLCCRPLKLGPGREYSLFPAPLLLSLHSKCPNSPLSS